MKSPQNCLNLLRRGIRLEFVKHTREIKRPEDIQGIRFSKDGQIFKASQISREFSFARLNAQLGWKTSESQQESERKVQQKIPDGGHLLESTGPGLFSPTNGTAPEEPLSQEELLRRRRKKKRRKGLKTKSTGCPFPCRKVTARQLTMKRMTPC